MFTWLFGRRIYHCRRGINPPTSSLCSPVAEDHTDILPRGPTGLDRVQASMQSPCGLMRKTASKPRTQGTKGKTADWG